MLLLFLELQFYLFFQGDEVQQTINQKNIGFLIVQMDYVLEGIINELIDLRLFLLEVLFVVFKHLNFLVVFN